MQKSNDKEKTKSSEDYTVIEILIAFKPEIFGFFKMIYDKRKSDLKTKLDNRPAKEEKELFLAEERKMITDELEQHPLFGTYQLLTKPMSEIQSISDTFVAAIPEISKVVSSEEDIKAANILQSVIQKYLQIDSKTELSNMGVIMKELSEIPGGEIALKSIAESKDAMTAFAYHLLKLEGDKYYLKHINKAYEELQKTEVKNIKQEKSLQKNLLSNSQTEQTDIQNLVQNSVKQALNEQKTLPTDEILSVEQASKYLNLAKQTIYGFTSKNEIPFFKKGKKLYFKRSELEQWLLTGKQKTLKETQKDAVDYINKKEKVIATNTISLFHTSVLFAF